MDYILQMEKLYKFFDFTLNLNEVRMMYNAKRKLNDDLNLFGSFIKDFLTIKNNGKVSDDESLYNDFVLWFESVSFETKKVSKEISEFAGYYRMIIFEEAKDDRILSAISTINACFAIDTYPNLMLLLNKYYNHKVDTQELYLMLECLTDIVLNRYENIQENVLSFEDLEKRIENSAELERAVV